MLPLRRKSDQTQAPLVPAWHPNLRNRERLPDTKVVRTLFFVNFAAIMVAASLLVYFCYQEYRIKNLSHQVAEWQAQVDANKKNAAQAVALSKKFADEEKKINELNEFLKHRLVLSELLLQLGGTLPADLAMDTVEVRSNGVDLRGTAAGTPDEASGRTSAYVDTLKQQPYFKNLFEDFALNRLDRAQGNERLTFELFMRFKGAPKK